MKLVISLSLEVLIAGSTKMKPDGFSDLVVSMPATGTLVCGFKPGRSRWIFQESEKSSACLPSEGK